MKAVKIIVVLLLAFGVIHWIRGSDNFDIRRSLPFVNDKPALFTTGGVALLILGAWGLGRIGRAGEDSVSDIDRGNSDRHEDENEW